MNIDQRIWKTFKEINR